MHDLAEVESTRRYRPLPDSVRENVSEEDS